MLKAILFLWFVQAHAIDPKCELSVVPILGDGWDERARLYEPVVDTRAPDGIAHWSNLGGVPETVQAAILGSRGIIHFGMYSQLASNRNLEGLHLDHRSALVLSSLYQRYGGADLGNRAYKVAEAIALQKPETRELGMVAFVRSLQVPEDKVEEILSAAAHDIDEVLAGRRTHSDFRDNYLRALYGAGFPMNCLERYRTADPRILEALFWMSQSHVLIKNHVALDIADRASAGEFNLDALVGFSRSLKSDVPWGPWHSFRARSGDAWGLKMTLEERLSLAHKLRGVSWMLFSDTLVEIVRISKSQDRPPVSWDDLILLVRGIESGQWTLQQILPFYDLNTYWPDLEGDYEVGQSSAAGAMHLLSLNLKRWRPTSQLRRWYPTEIRDWTEDYEGNEDFFVPLARVITPDLIRQFLSGELNWSAYREVFANDVRDNPITVSRIWGLGWLVGTKEVDGPAPAPTYEALVSRSHARGMAAARRK